MIELTDEIRARRVAVASDVIEQVNARKICISTGAYLLPLPGNQDAVLAMILDAKDKGLTDLQASVDAIGPLCRVCARGAMMLSKARLYNAVPIDTLFADWEPGYIEVSQGVTAEVLEDTFDPLTLAMIETSFELADMTDNEEWHDREAIHDAIWFGSRASSRRDNAEPRVLATMENIVENNGEFIP